MGKQLNADVFGVLTTLLYFLIYWTSAVKHSDEWKALLKQYAHTCGKEFICDENLLSNTSLVGHKKVSCPQCSCERSCSTARQQTCCLDRELDTCIRTTHGHDYKNEMYLMRDYCPQNTDKKLVRRCQALNEHQNMLLRNPVTSTSTGITYSNIECAKCNKDEDAIPWRIITSCVILEPDAYISKEKLWKYILKMHLSFKYSSPLNISPPRKCSTSTINQCNATSAAQKFDNAIAKACSAIYQPIGSFKNPFCQLCNAGDEKTEQPISMCNATGMMKEIDAHMPNACENGTVNWLAYPYKNKFCEECNIVRTKEGNIQLIDAEYVTFSSNNPVQKYHNMKPLNQVYVSNIYIQTLDFSTDPAMNDYLKKIKFGSAFATNIPLDSIEFGWTKQRRWCRRAEKYFFPVNKTLNPFTYEPPCSCNSNCRKSNSCCKVEGHILKPVRYWSCVQTSLPRTNDFYLSSYFMISKCPNNYTNEIIKSLCESDDIKFDFGFIPVTDIRTLTTYKNYFCYLCSNSPNISTNSVTEELHLIPWKINMECPKIFNFKQEIKFKSLMRKSISRKCLVNVVPGLRFHPPPKCELPGTENLYCAICERTREVVENCPELKDPDYRSIFSIFQNIDKKDENTPWTRCFTNEIYDKYRRKCRSLICPPGKQLMNGKCSQLFLSFTSKIYNIAFTARLNSSVGDRRMDVDLLIKSITTSFTDRLFNDTDLVITLLNYHFRFNRECQRIMTISKSHPLVFTVFMKLHILDLDTRRSQEHVDRDLIELRLFEATMRKGSSRDISFEYFQDVQGWLLPSLQKYLSLRSHCNKRFQSLSRESDYTGLDVTKLLFCPQISLIIPEFTFSRDGLHINVPIINKIFYYNQFYIANDTAVHICASDYIPNEFSSLIQTQTLNLLQLLTITSTSISLVSLVITFTVYCIFRNLRTIPGQNLMCFTCSLFLAQLLTLIKDLFSIDKVACTAVGMLTYYFWLSTFTCATSCCCHMSRVFACNVQFKNKKACSPTILAYILFTYLTPLVFICLSVVYNVSLSSDYLTGFGGNDCFIDGVNNKLFIFIIPISVFCLTNFLLFTVTFYRIYSTPEVENGPDRNYLSIYLKLFLLTGMTWTFQIIDGLFDISPFSYLVAVLNGTQGLYIMIAFVFNGRIRRMSQKLNLLDKLGFWKSDVRSTQYTE